MQAITLTIHLTEVDTRYNTEKLSECIRTKFGQAHMQQFSFSLDSYEVEIMRLRAKVIDASSEVDIQEVQAAEGTSPPSSAITERKDITVDGKSIEAVFLERSALNRYGCVIHGPAIISEMDSNTLILPGYYGEIDKMGNILIWPSEKSHTKNNMALKHSPESAREIVSDDPLISTLISSSLQSIRREMDSLMLRCAMSPAIREQQDEFNVISNPKGQMLVGQFGSFIPSFLEIWTGTIEEGDVFM